MLMTDKPVVVLNPRRAHYDPDRGDTLAQQVAWSTTTYISPISPCSGFPHWRPPGHRPADHPARTRHRDRRGATGGRRITVGADSRYPRRADLELQLHYAFLP